MSAAAIRMAIRIGLFAKKHYKEIILALVFILFLPTFISVLFTNFSSVPNIRPEDMEVYIKAASEVGEGKCTIDWRDLLAIDCVRYKQDLSKVNETNIKKLAEMFIIENQVTETTTDKDGNTTTTTKTVYECKTLEQMIEELGFSEEDKEAVKRYKEVGLSSLIGGEVTGEGTPFTGSQKEFVEKIKNGAIKTYYKYGIFPSVTIAQAIIESESGGSGLTQRANNLFGVKAFNGEPYVEMWTTEYYGGVPTQVLAKFVVYPSWEESIMDHGEFLIRNSRYKEHGVFSAKDYVEQCFALQSAGYATSPIYAVTLINTIRGGGLDKIDQEAMTMNK